MVCDPVRIQVEGGWLSASQERGPTSSLLDLGVRLQRLQSFENI